MLRGFAGSRELGKGAFASVFRAVDERTKEVVAIKRFTRQTLSRAAAETLISEITVLKRLRHPNIVTLFDHQWDDKYVYLIMEYCAGGDLAAYMRRRGVLSEALARHCMRQLARGLQFMSDHSLVHRDLKPANILLVQATEWPQLKIADFGFAQTIDGTATAKMGTPLYMAPEILTNASYDAKVDLWSLGIVFYEMLFGSTPFQSRTKEELLLKLTTPGEVMIPHRPDLSDEAKLLLNMLLQRDPSERMSFDELFSYEYLNLDQTEAAEGPGALEQARVSIVEAVRADQAGDGATAIRQYQRGIALLEAAANYEQDANKSSSLHSKCAEYRTRLLTLRKMAPSTATIARPPIRTSRTLSADKSGQSKADIAQRLVERAVMAESEGLLDEALRLYKRSVGVFMDAIKATTEEKQKMELRYICAAYLDKAEALQQQLNRRPSVASSPSAPAVNAPAATAPQMYTPPPRDQSVSACGMQ